jgi:hypothetical protein
VEIASLIFLIYFLCWLIKCESDEIWLTSAGVVAEPFNARPGAGHAVLILAAPHVRVDWVLVILISFANGVSNLTSREHLGAHNAVELFFCVAQFTLQAKQVLVFGVEHIFILQNSQR